MMQKEVEDNSRESNPTPSPIVDIDALRDDATKHIIEEIPGIAKRKNTYTYAELHKMKDVNIKFLLPQLLPRASLSILMGEDGVGKSQILGQLCCSICFGQELFCGVHLNSEHKKCLFVGTEDAKQKFASAITKQAYAMAPEHDPEDVGIFFTEASIFDEWKELKEEVEILTAEHSFDLIVLDTLTDLFGLIEGDINSNGDANKILGYFSNVAEQSGASCVIIHHVAKSHMAHKREKGKLFIEKNDAQGAGRITQRPRTVLALTNDPASSNKEGSLYTNYLHVAKANLMGRNFAMNAIQLEFSTETLLHRFISFVDIFKFEQERKKEIGVSPAKENKAETTAGQLRKLTPREIPDADHWKKLKEVFREKTPLDRDELIKRMCLLYDCGKSKIEAGDGYLPYLMNEKKWIQRVGKAYQWLDAAYNDKFDDPDELPF